MSKQKNTDYFSEFAEAEGADLDQASASSKASANEFAALLGESLKQRNKKVSVGDKIRGEILVLGQEDVFISTGTPVDGIMLRRDLLDETGLCPYKTGDVIECYVTQVRNGEIRLSKKSTDRHSAEDLEDAYDMMLPIQGRIVEVCKGGVRVNIKGKLAFCPISQIDTRHVEDALEYVGKSFDFKITQFSEGGRNIVVSRKKLLEEENALSSVSFLEEHPDGSVVSGRVTRLEKFGAFVELCPGVDGLVHISEIAWSRIGDPSEVLAVGQVVTVKLLKRETVQGKMKISLSIKQVTPKEEAAKPSNATRELTKYNVGKAVTGKILRKEVYGLFIEIEPGLSGLLHKSKAVDHPEFHYEKLKVGDTVTVQIAEIKDAERKISFAVARDPSEDDWKSHQPKSMVSFGTLGDAMKAALSKSKK